MAFAFRFSYPFGMSTRHSLSDLGGALEDSLRNTAVAYTINSKTRGSQKTFRYENRLSKSVIDEIDTVLAQQYQFTEEELDFIINYNIKYRMGDELYKDDSNAN